MNETRKFTIESTLDLLPEASVVIEASGYVELQTEMYGADADGRRGEIRTSVSEVHITQLWVYFPGRPPVRVAEGVVQVRNWVTKEELGLLEEIGCERVFLDGGEE